jgi:glycosyltransferase involved in cell wall biosynthesis
MEKQFHPLITIVTPSFNQGQFIEETIFSVLNQTYKNIQYILVDGGSNDNTMEVVNRYRDRIDSIIHEKDRGQADAINKGFRIAKGELVGWINSDDILYPDCLEKIVELYNENPNAAIYYHSKNNVIDEQSNIINTYQHIIPNRNHLLKINYNVVQQGSFYNRTLVERVGYLNIENHYSMDLDLWLSLLKHGSILCTYDKSHSGFRVYSGTKTDTGKENFLKNIYNVLVKHGAKYYYPTVWHRIYIYWFKVLIKKMIVK